MVCSQCGSQLPSNARFCMNCGFDLHAGSSQVNQPIKIIQLRCKNCNGIMNVEGDRTVFHCPYCGSKELLIENDNVKIAKIKSQARKDIELGKQQTNKDIELGKQNKDIEIKKQENKTKIIITIALLVFFGISGCFSNVILLILGSI